MPVRLQADPEVIRAAWEESSSGQDLCRRLGIRNHYTARRLITEIGLVWPKPEWGATVVPIAPEERIARDKTVTRLRAELSDLRTRYGTALKAQNAFDDLFAAVRDECCKPRSPIKLAPHRKSGTTLPTRSVVLQLSDWQLGELVHPNESGGNKYSVEVFQRRLDRWQDKVIKSVRNQSRVYAIERGVFAFCGDIVEGHDVYSGQPWALDMDAGRQVVEGGDWFAAAIESVVTSLPGIEWSVYCVTGNHGRPGGRKAGHLPATLNFDWMLYKWVERECANLPLREFAIESGGRLLFMLAGHVFLMTHGDEVRGWSGFPYYGLDKAHGRLVIDLETVFKYWLLAHWHQAASLPAGRGARIVNGNAVGANQLSQAAVLGSSTPEQNLLFVSPEFGVGEHAHIYLAPDEFTRPHIYGAEEATA